MLKVDWDNMLTKQGSVSGKKLADYLEISRKRMVELGDELVPPKGETEFVSLSDEIKEFYGKISMRYSERDYKELTRMEQVSDVALRDFKALTALLPKKKSRGFSLMLVPMFLFEFEGVYGNRLDSFCLQLVLNGHDLYDPTRRQYASSPSEIRDVDISTKFKFLERHNLKTLVRREDQKLRNRLAHYDFKLDNHGNISIGGQIVDLGSKLMNLSIFLLGVSLVNTQGIHTVLRKLQSRTTVSKSPAGSKKEG